MPRMYTKFRREKIAYFVLVYFCISKYTFEPTLKNSPRENASILRPDGPQSEAIQWKRAYYKH